MCSCCGYEAEDPDGIWSDALEQYLCTDCEATIKAFVSGVLESGGEFGYRVDDRRKLVFRLQLIGEDA